MRGIPEDKIKAWIKDVNGRCLDDTWWIENELLEYIEELQEPWMTLDEFLKSGFVGKCWILAENDTVHEARYSNNQFDVAVSIYCFDHDKIRGVMPIHKPEPPRWVITLL